jgi:hypothetical protein
MRRDHAARRETITQAAEDELKRLYSAKISQAWACEIFGLDQQGCILRPGAMGR